MADALQCEFITNSSTCIIQDRSTRAEMERDDRVDGLYYLRHQPTIVAATSVVSSSLGLWHARLGHPSVDVVK